MQWFLLHLDNKTTSFYEVNKIENRNIHRLCSHSLDLYLNLSVPQRTTCSDFHYNIFLALKPKGTQAQVAPFSLLLQFNLALL